MTTDTTTTSNMGLVLPLPSVCTGPRYATLINAALTTLDTHNHASGNGVNITPAGLDINSDLDIGGNNLTDARSLRLATQSATLSGSTDLGCLSNINGDLYWNNSAGTQIAITTGGSINIGAVSTNIWASTIITANLTVLGSDNISNINVNSSSPITISLPAANAISAGRYYVIQDISGNSQTYNITLSPNGSNTINNSSGSKTLASNYGTWFIRSDGSTKWQLTYTGFSGLTASALTYGSTVLNSSGLTVGSNSLTSSTLTVGSSTLTTSALTVATQVLNSSGLTLTGGTSLSTTLLTIASGSTLSSSSLNIGTTSLDTYELTVAGSASLNGTTLSLGSTTLEDAILTLGNTVLEDATLTLGVSSATTGAVRMQNNTAITARNAGDTNNFTLISSNTSDQVVVGTDSSLISLSSPMYTNSNIQVDSSGNYTYYTPRTKSSRLPLFSPMVTYGNQTRSSYALFNTMGTAYNDVQCMSGLLIFNLAPGSSLTTGVLYSIDAHLHDGSTLDTVVMTLVGSLGHGGLPTTQPSIGVFRHSITYGLESLRSSGDYQIGSAASIGAYQAFHTTTATCDQRNTIDKSTYTYFIHIWNEMGAWSQAGLEVVSVVLNSTVSTLMP